MVRVQRCMLGLSDEMRQSVCLKTFLKWNMHVPRNFSLGKAPCLVPDQASTVKWLSTDHNRRIQGWPRGSFHSKKKQIKATGKSIETLNLRRASPFRRSEVKLQWRKQKWQQDVHCVRMHTVVSDREIAAAMAFRPTASMRSPSAHCEGRTASRNALELWMEATVYTRQWII